jgi:dTDP-4-dehydrorhamnose reductase
MITTSHMNGQAKMADKILITGSKGMLGRDLVSIFRKNRYEVTAYDVSELDITDSSACDAVIENVKPDIIINAAAYTDVDKAEEEKDKAKKINGDGAGNLAKTASKNGALIVYFSTDYIFDGKKKEEYTEDDKPNPISAYGRSKLMGEDKIKDATDDYLIIRTEWLYGKYGNNFVKSIINAASSGENLKVVNDQEGSPTYTVDLADATFRLIKEKARGIINFTSTGHTTWFDFAELIMKKLKIGTLKVIPISSADLNRPAKRPANSRLALEKYIKITGDKPPDYQKALDRYFKSILII